MGLEPTTTGTTIRGSTWLSYTHRWLIKFYKILLARQQAMARLAGLEPATYGLEGRCSIRLSYRRSRMAHLGSRPNLSIGVERFELPTSCSQSRRATRLRYTPNFLPRWYALPMLCQLWPSCCFRKRFVARARGLQLSVETPNEASDADR